jgi:protein gp37
MMGKNSKIEWCDNTLNPWIGCQKVSPGCDHCYAEKAMDHRFKKVQWGPHGKRIGRKLEKADPVERASSLG